MAAGTIYLTVTTTTGETIELPFYVDDTVSPTTWKPIHLLAKSDGTILDPTTLATQTTLAALLTAHGSADDAAVITDANGTARQYLRGLVKMFAAGLAITGSVALAAGSALIGSFTPKYSDVGNVTLQSNATGTTYNVFGSQACCEATLVNDTGTDIEYRFDAGGAAVTIWNGCERTISGIANMNEIGYRRKDVSNTQVTLMAMWNS